MLPTVLPHNTGLQAKVDSTSSSSPKQGEAELLTEAEWLFECKVQ